MIISTIVILFTILIGSYTGKRDSANDMTHMSKFLDINGYKPISIGPAKYITACGEEDYYGYTFTANPPNKPETIVSGIVCCSYDNYCYIKMK